MEQKSWLWKKKTSEKIIGKKSGILKEKALELERSLDDLNEQLSSVRTECSAKDDLLEKQAKVAEEAIAGWEKAESEALCFSQQLEDALLQKEAAEERIVKIDASLKECMQQLRIAKQDQQIIVENATTKISREREKVRKLEENLVETNRRLTELVIQHNNLSRKLDLKEQLIRDLNESKSNLEVTIAEVNSRLEASEKNNASLKYELCILDKELHIRNEEKNFNIRSADTAHRQQLECVKKIAKLESECQRLRVMLRKRLPGPAALAKMRSEVEILSGVSTEMRKRRTNITVEPSQFGDLVPEDQYVLSNKAAASLGDRLRAIEEENKVLRESLLRKNSELQSSNVICAQTAAKLSRVESQLEELSKRQISSELSRSSPLPCDTPLASISEHGGNEDNISSAGSWASALMSELDLFTSGKKASQSCRSAGASDLSLMDDFIEMEKLAIVSCNAGMERSPMKQCTPALKDSRVGDDLSESMGKELALVESLSDFSEENFEKQISYEQFVKCPSWLQDILRVIIQKNHMTKRSFQDILEQVRSALSLAGNSSEVNNMDLVLHNNESIVQSSKKSSNSSDGTVSTVMAHKMSSERNNSNLEKQILKLIELLEGVIQKNIQTNNLQLSISEDDRGCSLNKKSPSLNGYVSRAFLWEGSELVSVLRHFVTVCTSLLCGKADLEKFTAEIITALDWIMSHCFSLQDVSDIKESIMKNLDSGDSLGHNDLKVVIYPTSEIDQLCTNEDENDAKELSVFSISQSNGVFVSTRLKDQTKRLESKIVHMESRKKDLEEKLKTASNKDELLFTDLQRSEKNNLNLQEELEILQDSKGLFEDQIENQKLINEDLGSQLNSAKAELDVARQNFSLLEVQLEEKNNCCEELEARCLELQLQLESTSSRGTYKHVSGEEKHLHKENEIAAASDKLAACQETILNLGKQLKSLASPANAQLIDKVLSPASVKPGHQSQLLDHVKAEDSSTSEELKFSKCKDNLPIVKESPAAGACEYPSSGLFYGQAVKKSTYTNNSLINVMMKPHVESPASKNDGKLIMVVPKKQKGDISLLRKLLLRNKKDINEKLTFPVTT